MACCEFKCITLFHPGQPQARKTIITQRAPIIIMAFSNRELAVENPSPTPSPTWELKNDFSLLILFSNSPHYQSTAYLFKAGLIVGCKHHPFRYSDICGILVWFNKWSEGYLCKTYSSLIYTVNEKSFSNSSPKTYIFGVYETWHLTNIGGWIRRQLQAHCGIVFEIANHHAFHVNIENNTKSNTNRMYGGSVCVFY